MLELVGLIVTPIIGLLGVFVGSKLARDNEVRIRKEFLAREIKIEKYEELSRNLHEYLRIITRIHNAIINFEKGDINHEGFKKKNNELQEEALIIQRTISVNRVFVLEFEYNLNRFTDGFARYCDKIYDGYQNPNNANPVYDKSEVTYEEIKLEMMSCSSLGLDIIESINKKINAELNALLK